MKIRLSLALTALVALLLGLPLTADWPITEKVDHLSFAAVGLPGFQFIQDPIEYDSRTHHSNMDVYERAQANDMMRNAVIVIVAAFALNSAKGAFPICSR